MGQVNRALLAAASPVLEDILRANSADWTIALHADPEEFRALWEQHEVGIVPRTGKRYLHPEVGKLELDCQILHDPESSHSLLVYTAEPGSESAEKLQLLSVISAPAVV